jgi:hypothetical protein
MAGVNYPIWVEGSGKHSQQPGYFKNETLYLKKIRRITVQNFNKKVLIRF